MNNARGPGGELKSSAENEQVIVQLGFADDMARLRSTIKRWMKTCSDEMQLALDWQFGGNSKYFRPSTVFSCYRANYDGDIPDTIIHSALVIEIFHNISLIIDDILDRSEYRRNKLTLHTRFGDLQALMTSGYMTAEGFELVRDDPGAISLFAELMKRLADAECMQWRLRKKPLGVEDWRRIAGEDTGSMFEICACLGDRTERLRRFGHLLGVLYHGCDDVGDVRGGEALGGGGVEDIRDGILTLPAGIAIQNPAVARMFMDPNESNYDALAEAFLATIPAAEAYLDQVARDAETEARTFSKNPAPLIAIVDQTRALSGR